MSRLSENQRRTGRIVIAAPFSNIPAVTFKLCSNLSRIDIVHRNGRYGISDRSCCHCTLMLAARMTLPHFSISNAICLPNSCGVLPTIP